MNHSGYSRIFIVLAAVGLLAMLTAPAAVAQGLPSRVSGTIDGAGDGWLALADGTTLTLTADSQLTVSRPATPADLQPGMFVAITATRDIDGALLASTINIFSPSNPGRVGQFPMTGDNIMTNANIDEATIGDMSSGEFDVSFNDQTDHVRLAPDANINVRQDGTIDDLQQGDWVEAYAADGIASYVTVYPDQTA